MALIDAGRETVRVCAAQLREQGLLTDRETPGSCRFFVSDRPEGFVRVADMFLGRPVDDDIARVLMDELTG